MPRTSTRQPGRIGSVPTNLSSLLISPAPSVEETPASRPTREDAVRQIVIETNCTNDEAVKMLSWLSAIIDRARSSKQHNGKSIAHPSTLEMADRSYTIFDSVVPHDATPQPGSAHDIVGRYLLDPSKDEVLLTHYRLRRGDRTYCAVEIGYRF